MGQTAIVIGATGLTGSNLTTQLLQDNRFDTVKVFTRRPTGLESPRLEEHIINFDAPEEWQHLVTGDILFSALGTTLKKAGGQQKQFTIDYTYQYQFAEAAAYQGVPVYVLVSSSGANPNALVFYSRMKGELEAAVEPMPFKHIHILQPGPIAGEREEPRAMEKTGFRVINWLNEKGLFRRYRPILGEELAACMIHISQLSPTGKVHRYELDEIFKYQ